MYLAAIDRTSAARGDDVVGARDPMDQPRRLLHLGTERGRVECEPACAARRDCLRIDGDDFEIGLLAELEEAVVRAHRDVPAAAQRASAEPRLDIVLALLERRRRHDEMV